MMTPAPVEFPFRGDVAKLLESIDWTKTSLGPRESWPASLRTVLSVMMTSRYAMWLGWGPDLVMFYNDAYKEQTLGAKHPWALGRSAREVWAEIWDLLGPRIDRVLTGGEATWDAGLLLFLERSGYPEETYHTFSYSPLPTDDGRIGGMFCVVTEETERVIAERRMRILRELGAALNRANTSAEVLIAAQQTLGLDDSGIPFSLIYLFDDQGAHASLVSRTHIDPAHGAAPASIALDDPNAPWPLRAVLARGETIEFQLDPKRTWPKGPWPQSPAKAVIVPIAQQGEAQPAGAVVVGMNPHRPFDDGYRAFLALIVGQFAAGLANARAYEAEKKRAEGLAELDRAKTAFFSNISHEFRTPLTLMLGPTEDALAARDRALRGQDLEIVYRNELRLLKLVNTLLDFSRIEAGRVNASYEELDLAALTAGLASVFRSAIERAGLSLVIDAKTEVIAFVDRDMWEKIILNLLSNALKFTFAGEISVHVTAENGQAIVRVKDSGTGVAPSELPHLFERFHRVEGARARTHEGSGIGLALVNELVKLHGGAVEVESTLDVGTTFTIKIATGASHLSKERIVAASEAPAVPARAASYVQEALRWTGAPPEERPAPDSTNPTPNGERARILLADDNADMREYVARLLGDHWSVATFSDGADAIDALEREHFDLVLSDVMMPHLDGTELVRAIRANPETAQLPVILLSARAGEEAIADGLRSGADDYLVKPFSASALVVRVEAQLAAARSREALRRHAESELERLRTLFEASPSALSILRGEEFVIELANPIILAMWGRTNDVIGKPLFEAIPELVGQGFEELLRGVRETGVAHHGEEVLARINLPGRGLVDAYFDFVYAPMRDGEGRVNGVLVHAFEVTELVGQRRAALDANRMKDEFLATMSHELRTPLNAILGWSSMLRTQRHDEPVRTKALETIERNARSQARPIDDILDVSRIVSGKLKLSLEAIDVATVVHAAIDVVRPATVAKGVHLTADVDACGFLTGDADRLQQVIWNLLINAVRFTPAGGTIAVSARRTNSSLQVTVRDTGAGIPAAHVDHVFERFRQVDSSTTRKHGGLGLGLAIVRHVVELHGGTVRVESPGPNLGTTFTVSLPIRAVVLRDTGDAPPPVPAGGLEAEAAPLHLEGLFVLVAEDDADSRELIESALKSAGARVTTADDAARALEALRKELPDVLVSDIGMPGEDGYALIRKVRALGKSRAANVPAIALTAYARKEDERLALSAGYDKHLAKPIYPALLVEAVAQAAQIRPVRE